jgi:hypothetical protein
VGASVSELRIQEHSVNDQRGHEDSITEQRVCMKTFGVHEEDTEWFFRVRRVSGTKWSSMKS